jgi:hypothetical protein
METLHFQEHDRSHLCPARDPTSVQCALPTLKCTQAITARSKSNSHYPKPQKRHCASPPRSSAPPPRNWKLLDLSLLTNLPDTRDGPQLSHGSVSSPSKLSPYSRVRGFEISFRPFPRDAVHHPRCRTLGPNFPRSQRDVSLYVWQLGKLSPPTTTCHIRRQLVAGTIRESRRQIRAP